MTTLSQVGKDIKKGMKFKDERNVYTDYWQIDSEMYQIGQFSQGVDVTRYYTDGAHIQTNWNDWEFTGIHANLELIDPESWGYGQQELKIEEPKRCYHYNKRKVLLFSSAYWLCECGEDLGTCTEEEYQKCVKENI